MFLRAGALVLLTACTPLLLAQPATANTETAAQPPLDVAETSTDHGPDVTAPTPPDERVGVPLVFVQRQIPPSGTIYWDEPRDMPGVGARSRVRPAPPGRLLVREPDGRIRVLIDGARPTAASLQLIDVNAPEVSYDGRTIVFSGLPAGPYDASPASTVGRWRIFAIEADGSNLRQITFSDQGDLIYSTAQFGLSAPGLRSFDDYDPVFLPDGRICFASTRYPSLGQYSAVRASNLHVVNLDGSDLHRITSERNGADRPLVDPLTGRIVYSRWWRNHRFPIHDMTTIPTEVGPAVYGYSGAAYIQHLGLTGDRDNPVGGGSMFRNAWQATSMNPDGSDLRMFSGRFRDEAANHSYGGGFAPDGAFYGNFFPMFNMTEAAGFGGIRRFVRGPQRWSPVIGITSMTLQYVHYDPISYGVFVGNYAAEPEVLPDGRLVISWARDHMQDYGLYLVNPDGTGLERLYDAPGTTELRARVLAPRSLPPIAPDVYRDNPAVPFPNRLPPPAGGPYEQDGQFVFAALNVYANAPVDADIVSAPPVGSAGTIRFFLDQQRQSPGSFPHIDWPILLDEQPVSPAGVVIAPAPANVPLFEQLRSPAPLYQVPLTGGPYANGAAHVTGFNFAPAGAVARCVGCHAGHTQMSIPPEPEFSNLAPGAILQVSSARDPNYTGGLIDRRARTGEVWRYWNSAPGQQSNQWVRLIFRVPVTVRTVRLYNPRFGDEAGSTLQVNAATVILYDDAASTIEVARRASGPLAVEGTDVPFADLRARSVRINLDSVTGRFYGIQLAALAEVEVIARGEAGP